MELIKKNKKIFKNQFVYFIDLDTRNIYFLKASIENLLPNFSQFIKYQKIESEDLVLLDVLMSEILKNYDADFFLWLNYILKDYLISGASLNEELLLQEMDVLSKLNQKVIALNEKYILLHNKKRRMA